MSYDESFGQRVRQERRALDLTQEELARRVGCAAITIRKIEAGDLRPSQQIAERLAMALGIPLDQRSEFVRQARSVQLAGRPIEPPHAAEITSEEIGLADLSGRAIRGYQLGEKIGAGSFGTVYRAVQPLVEREVAIKIILPKYANHPDFIRCFEAEAQLVARLEHPHIVPLYDYWREPGVAYLVMRLLRGGSLNDLIEREPLSLDQTAHLLEQICAALQAAHRAGVVHRDLKPSNVLLDEDGNAYLADFGIAKNLGALEAQTPTDMVIGSPAYLSPEQALSEPVRPQTDIYSLGVMLYEMLTGVKPFTGPTPILLIQQHLYAPLPPLAAHRSGRPAAFDDIISRATAKEPLQRYAEVDALLADFKQVVQTGRLAETIALPPAALEPIVIANPYKGLHPFAEADAPDFFGRGALTQQLLARLGEGGDLNRFLAIIGPSGSGKSSVVGAGLVPALRRGGLPNSENWFIVETLPGAHPLEELEAALLRIAVNPPVSLLSQIREDKRGLLRAIQRSLPADDGRPGDSTELVLVLDQFEEVFTLVEDESERALLLDAIAEAVLAEHSRVRVIVTLRADFVDKPLRYIDFAELVQHRSEFVLPLTPDEMERAIAGPAERVGLKLEGGLVEAISGDVIDQPGGLPLLQYALTELFEKRTDHTLTKATYQAIGGVKGALGRRAEEVYQALDESQQALARQVFLRLVTLGEGSEDTRRRVLLAELKSLSTTPSAPPTLQWRVGYGEDTKSTKTGEENLSELRDLRGSNEMAAVLDAFGKARLLSFDRDLQTRGPTVEVAHEALLREWPRLRDWLNDSRGDVRLQRRLANETAEWLSANSEASFLLRGTRLQQFEDWAKTTNIALTNDERTYLEASFAEREQQRLAEEQRREREVKLEHRAKRVLQGLFAVAVIAAIISGALALIANNREQEAQSQRQLAEMQKQEALRQASIGLAAQSEAELDGTAPERGVLLALEALENYPYTGQAESALAKAVENSAPYYDLESHETIGSMGWLVGTWSPDGDRFAAGSDVSGLIVIWSTVTGEPISTITSTANLTSTTNFNCGIADLSWSPHGDQLIAIMPQYYARDCPQVQPPTVWNVTTKDIVHVFDSYHNEASSADWSADGQLIAIGDISGTVKLWDARTGMLHFNLTGHAAPVTDVAFSPKGDRLATASEDGAVKIWNVSAGTVITTLPNLLSSVTSVSWSPDGLQIATSSADGLGRIWNVETALVAATLRGHTASVNDIAWSPTGERVATISRDGTVRVWGAQTGDEDRRIHTSAYTTVAWSPQGDQLAAGGVGAVTYMRIWRVPKGPRQLMGLTIFQIDAQWSPDGTKIASIGNGYTNDDLTAHIWDADTKQELHRLENPKLSGYFAWSPDSRYIATPGYGGKALIWDANTGQVVTETTLRPDPNYLWAIGWSRDGQRLAGASYPDYVTTIWEARTGKVINTVGDGTCFMHAPDWSPTADRFVTGCVFSAAVKDNTPLTIWDADGNKVMELPSSNGESIRGEWSPDGSRIAVGYEDGTAKIWQAGTGKELLRISASNGVWIWHVSWSPDGKRLASGDNNGIIKVWDAETGTEVENIQQSDVALVVHWSPDGKYLISNSVPYIKRVWRSTDELIQYAKQCCVFRELTPAERQQFGLAAK